jgi:predicted transcriptional regulator
MQEVAAMPQSVVEMTKDLVSAQIQSGTLAPEDMQEALRRTHQSLMTLKSREEAKAQVGPPVANGQKLAVANMPLRSQGT